MNIIAGKCTMKINDLKNVIESGVKYVEFHTFETDFNNTNFKENMYKLRKFLDDNDMICHSIHMPIVSDNNMPEKYCFGNLYENSLTSFFKMITKLVYAADILCKTDNPIIVTHLGTCYFLEDNKKNNLDNCAIQNVIKKMEEELKIINNFLDSINSNVTIVVENMPDFYIGDRGIVAQYFGKNDELPKLIEKLNLSHIKTCLDVCHTLCNIKVNNLNNPYKKLTLTNYMEYFKDSIGLIHLNNLIDFGEVTAKHSQPFINTKEDLILLKEFFKCLEEYNITCPITLEINEIDYSKRLNLVETLSTIQTIIN